MSAGVKGARIVVGPKGTFAHLGSNGVYYKKRIDSPDTRRKVHDQDYQPGYGSTEGTHSITSLNFDNLSDSDSQEFIKELEHKDRKISFLPIFGIIPRDSTADLLLELVN